MASSIKSQRMRFFVFVSVLWLIQTVDAQIGTTACACLPTFYEFTLNFSHSGNSCTVAGTTGVSETVCYVSSGPQNENMTNFVPVLVNSIFIAEVDQESLVIGSQFLGNLSLVNGDQFNYTSVLANPENLTEETLPRSILITVEAISAGNERSTNFLVVTYNSTCTVAVSIPVGQELGWTFFSELGPPNSEVCPLVTAAPSVPSEIPSFTPTETPIQTPSPITVPPSPAPVAPLIPTTPAPVTEAPAPVTEAPAPVTEAPAPVTEIPTPVAEPSTPPTTSPIIPPTEEPSTSPTTSPVIPPTEAPFVTIDPSPSPSSTPSSSPSASPSTTPPISTPINTPTIDPTVETVAPSIDSPLSVPVSPLPTRPICPPIGKGKGAVTHRPTHYVMESTKKSRNTSQSKDAAKINGKSIKNMYTRLKDKKDNRLGRRLMTGGTSSPTFYPSSCPEDHDDNANSLRF